MFKVQKASPHNYEFMSRHSINKKKEQPVKFLQLITKCYMYIQKYYNTISLIITISSGCKKQFSFNFQGKFSILFSMKILIFITERLQTFLVTSRYCIRVNHMTYFYLPLYVLFKFIYKLPHSTIFFLLAEKN